MVQFDPTNANIQWRGWRPPATMPERLSGSLTGWISREFWLSIDSQKSVDAELRPRNPKLAFHTLFDLWV